MLRRSFPIILLLCLGLLLLMVLPFGRTHVSAQDDQIVTNTPAPESTVAVVATINGNPVGATLVAPSDNKPLPLSPDNAISIVELVRGIIISVLSGGTVAAILARFGGNKVNQDSAEKLYQSQSPAAQERERQMFEGLREITLRVLDYVDKVTDGLPNTPVAQLTAMEGPALATRTELDELSSKLAFHQTHYPIPSSENSKPADLPLVG